MKIYTSAQIPIPTTLNLTELLHSSATSTPLLPSHLIASDSLTNRSLTLGELRDRSGRYARGFQEKLQAKEGDRWAIILPNSVEYIELFHAVLWVGGVSCPINHALKPAEIAHAVAVSKPRFVLAYCDSLGSGSIERILEGIDIAWKQMRGDWEMPEVISVISESPQNRLSHITSYLAASPLPIPHYEDTRTHVASIHLSSGTTGPPKGVLLTHHNFVANCIQLYAHDPKQFHPASRTVAFTPFVHIAMTTMPLFLGPWTGMFHHAMPSFSIDKFGPLVTSIRATSYQGVPSIALALANSDITKHYDFSSAEVINCGGAPMKQDVIDRLTSRAPWKMIQVYGMTEGAPYIAYQKLNQPIAPGEIGNLLPNIEGMLKVEGTSTDAPLGGPGELWLRGPNICVGYSDPVTNAKAFPLEGWYNTGDVCTITSSGIVSVVGRTKELIKYKGFQVSPAELEAHLNSHPSVLESGVSSVWDESQLTELPTAFIILNPEVEKQLAESGLVGEDEVRRICKEVHLTVDGLVTGYKKLRGGVWQVRRFEKNATGKFLRKELGRWRTGLGSVDVWLGDERAKL